LQRVVSFLYGKRFDLYEYLNGLFIFSLIDMVIFNTKCSEKLSDKIGETQMLIAPVFEYEIVSETFFIEKRCSDGVLSVEVLGQKKRSKGFLYAFELGIEGTIVEVDLFDDRIAFDVVVTVVEF